MSNIVWHPDTCNCKIEIDESWKLVNIQQKCVLHQNILDTVLVLTIITHNKSFNVPPANSLTGYTQLELTTIANNKLVAKSSNVASL